MKCIAFQLAVLLALVSCSPEPQSELDQVVAIVNSKKIHGKDVFPAIKEEILELKRRIHDLKLQAIQNQISQEVVAWEARKRNIAPSELFDQFKGIEKFEVTQDEIEFYFGGKQGLSEADKKEIRQGRFEIAKEKMILSLRDRSAIRVLVPPPTEKTVFALCSKSDENRDQAETPDL